MFRFYWTVLVLNFLLQICIGVGLLIGNVGPPQVWIDIPLNFQIFTAL
jgi:hypothetical protein